MRRKLLLADDSITVQRVIELTFADEDLDVSTVGDGGQAIALIERDRPDIVFADLTMPVRDGYGVAEHVKRTPALAGQTRVVLLTGAFEPVDQERVGLLGIDGVLAKPFEPRAAIALVHELLAKPPQAAKPRDDRTAAAGYPFEPGAGGPRSSPAELDDYFQRLDEALASAGLVASSAVRDMLAESKGGRDGAARDGASKDSAGKDGAGKDGAGSDEKDKARPTAGAADAARVAAADGVTPAASAAAAGAITAAPGTGGAAPGVAGALASLAEAVKEKKTQMSATPSVPASGTLVDAFSALLAEEQGEAPADRGATDRGPAGRGPAEASQADPGRAEGGAFASGAAPPSSSGSSSSGSGYFSQSTIDGASAARALASAGGTGDGAAADGGTATASDVGSGGVAGDAAFVSGDASDSSGSTSAAVATGVSIATGTDAENAGRAGPGGLVALASAGSGAASATPGLPGALPMTDEFLDAVARRIVDQYGERILREVVTAQVVDIAERLVREEIERLKAAADRV